MPRRSTGLLDLSLAVVIRLQRRHAAGTSLAALATELGIAKARLRKRLLAVPAITGGTENAPPEVKPPRSARMPHRLRPLPSRPVGSEPSKNELRAALHAAVLNTARL
jgi:hypothetical protein